MVTISFNLFKTETGYDISISAEENGKIVLEESFDSVEDINDKALVVRKKAIGIGDKNVTFGLNIIDGKLPAEEIKPKKKTKKVTK